MRDATSLEGPEPAFSNRHAVSEKPITVLICGAGSRGRTIYGQYLLDNPDVAKVVAVAEPQESRRRAMMQEHDIPESAAFESWRDLPSRPIADVAVVATDDRGHVEPAVRFLEQGYHVLLEKPMAPDLEGCQKIVSAAQRAKGMSAVCHVLRYTPYFLKLKSLIEDGLVGRVVTIRHLEPVNYWHFAHSFVRGNWRNSATSSVFLLTKCCHDMDILQYLMGEKPVAVHSFGALSHFTPQSAPAEATARCVDCSLRDSCAYSATKFYGDMLKSDKHWWPLDVLVDEFTTQALDKSLRDGPYGRCVYACDNDVCDHQVVNFEFQSGATGSLVATAFTELPARQTEVMGSLGSLSGDGSKIVHRDFRNGQTQEFEVASTGKHLGGDEAMMKEFFGAVRAQDASRLSTSPEVSLLSHRMAFLAERSRIERKVVEL
jgi:predicted dehydrogenase